MSEAKNSDYCIEAKGISKQFGDLLAVNNLDLNVPQSSIYGFLGPNGSGKSTTFRMLTGLLLPTKGSIRILDCNLPKDTEKLRTLIGYVTQQFSLYRDLTVEENLRFVAKIFGLNYREENKRVEELLSSYHLLRYRKQLAGNLSGGERQRLSLASAIVHKPQLLFLDEPTAAVDPENRRDFWEKLFELAELNTTILVSTHYMEEAYRCHYLAIIDHGAIRADDTPDNLISKINANVVEITNSDLRAIRNDAQKLAPIISVTQQGHKLRLLVDAVISEPCDWLQQQLQTRHHNLQIAKTTANLEDVFVRFTHKDKHASTTA